MANMGYCRFRNTLSDLDDCADYMEDSDISPEEHAARKRLVALMARMLRDLGGHVDAEGIDMDCYAPEAA